MIAGDVLGKKYELEARLGKGGMGEVWRARHTESGEHVAVKVLLDELAQDGALQKRFLREARAAAAVKHPNVVELREIQEGDDGTPFLVMELLEGETLGRRLKRMGALSVAETAAIMLPVFDAVEAAHAAGLVHRDLKPENIFLARESGVRGESGVSVRGESVRVRVLDFGIAKRIEKLAAPTTSSSAETTAAPATTGAMLGTPYYMAPEQALGEKDIDGLADVWSVGVIVYECLAGRRPTEAATLGAILKIIVTDGVVPLWEVMPGVDASLAAAVMRMLRTSRAERAPSLDEIRAVLAGHLDPSFLLEPPAPDSERGRISRAHEPARPRTTELQEHARTSRRRIIWTLALGATAVTIGVRLFGGRAEAPAPTSLAAEVAAPAASSASSAPAAPASLAHVEAAPTVTVAVTAAPSSTAIGAITGPATAAASARPRGAAPIATTAASSRSTVAPSAGPAASGPTRGPSGLVTDNPFAAPSGSPR